jgi:hypothetical protein
MTAINPPGQPSAASQPPGDQPASSYTASPTEAATPLTPSAASAAAGEDVAASPGEMEHGANAGTPVTKSVAAALDRLREAASSHDHDGPEAP